MAGNADNLFLKIGDPGSATNLTANYTAGATSITVASTANWTTTGEGVIFAMDMAEVVNGVERQIAGTYNEFEGTVASATSITNVDWVRGAGDTDYNAGALTRVYIPVSAERENRLIDGLLVSHDQDGTLKAGAVDNVGVFASGVISTTAPFSTALNPTTHLDETTFDHVASGCVWSGDAYGSTRVASMTSGVVYIDGTRVPVSAVTSRTFTASRDTYIDVGTDGVVDYTEVTNNNASPALASGHIRLGIIVTGASNIANVGSVNQGQENKVLPIASSIAYSVTDSLGNLICPRDPNRKVLGYRQILTSFSVTSATMTQVTGLSCPVIVPSERKVLVTAYSTSFSINAASTPVATLWRGVVASGTQIQQLNAISSSTLATYCNIEAEETPTSGAQTYNVGVASSSGQVTFTGTSSAPAFIKVELA